jgi:O-antigen/teichoic acid export membrane protein
MAIAFGLCTLLTPFSGPIVHLLYGLRYAAAGPLLAVLIWSEGPVFFGVVMSNALVAKNLQNYLPLSTVIGAAVNVVLNLYLIPRWGAMGAAWATNVSYTLAGILLFLAFPGTRPLAWLGIRILAPPCGLALFVTWSLKVISLAGPARFLVAFGLYALGAWLLGSIQRTDLNQVLQLIGRNVASFRNRAA